MWQHYTDEETKQWKHLMLRMIDIIEMEIENFKKLEKARKENSDEAF